MLGSFANIALTRDILSIKSVVGVLVNPI